MLSIGRLHFEPVNEDIYVIGKTCQLLFIANAAVLKKKSLVNISNRNAIYVQGVPKKTAIVLQYLKQGTILN